MQEKIIEYIESISRKIISYRRDFHQFPEVGWTEFRTASKIAKKLAELGFEIEIGREVISDKDRMGLPAEEELEFHYKRAIKHGADLKYVECLKGGFTGVVGTLDLGDGPCIALRFDIDALKIDECKGEEHTPCKYGFASINDGVMHACGHDGHAAIGLGVAEAISNFKEHITGAGKIKLIFQPAEEGVRGAKSMVCADVLDDADYVIGGHIMADVPQGTLICGANGFLATTKLDVNFKGLAAHAGAAPNEGKNSMLAACTAVLNINAIPRHRDGDSRVNVGMLVSGTERNIIPGEAYMKIETRGKTNKINEYVRDYALRIIENSAKMHDAAYEVKYVGEAIGASCSDELISYVKEIGQSIGCFNKIVEKSSDFGGSEDFTYMMNKVQQNGGQSTYCVIGTDYKAGHHNGKFDCNEDDLIKAVKLFTCLALDILENGKR